MPPLLGWSAFDLSSCSLAGTGQRSKTEDAAAGNQQRREWMQQHQVENKNKYNRDSNPSVFIFAAGFISIVGLFGQRISAKPREAATCTVIPVYYYRVIWIFNIYTRVW